MNHWPEGVRLESFAEVDSTNRIGLERLAAGEAGPLWLRADVQSAGRGRAGRTWASPAGNLYASYVQHVSCAPAVAAQLSLVAGVALHATLADLAPAVTCQLKWPNDVLVGGAKLAGILIESRAAALGAASATGVVIGCGVNLAHAPPAPGRATTALASYGVALQPDAALAALARQLQHALQVWDLGRGFDSIRTRWLAAGPARGTAVLVTGAGQPVAGFFAGLAEDGSLLVSPEPAESAGPPAAQSTGPGKTGVVRRITFGDVEYRQS